MTPFKIVLAYDGTDFVGWQRQASGTSVQGLLEAALQDLDRQDVAVVGAGRTDAGVHARGQVASFALSRMIDAATLVGALNARLPETVRVLSAEIVPESFHARFGARRKTYCYRIWNADVLDPFERCYVWHVIGPLDIGAMGAAALSVEGRHDFAAFQASGGAARSTVREVFRSRVSEAQHPDDERHGTAAGAARHGSLVTYEITGDGFLRHMVRTIVGTLVEVGRGRRSAGWMHEVLAGGNRAAAGPTAPPEGLALVSVEYPPGLLAADP